jgi:hypothetical protein
MVVTGTLVAAIPAHRPSSPAFERLSRMPGIVDASVVTTP